MKNCRSLVLSFLFACGSAYAAAKTPQCFGASPAVLAEVKERLANEDPALEPALTQLLEESYMALKVQPPTVTAKPKPPLGRNKHDSMAATPYVRLVDAGDAAKPLDSSDS